jgi:ATP-dependent RNA helicase RhlE
LRAHLLEKNTYMTKLTFAELNLGQQILDALISEKYETPTPIQAKAIPALLGGRDLLGIAQTGTGKTAAFVLPILRKLSEKPTKAIPCKPQALILAPTRELAIQIGEAVQTYGQNLHLRHAVIFGGVGQKPQTEKMRRGVHILVATPGRLMDLMRQGHVELDRVSFFVLDEADRMLDMGFINDVRTVAAALPEKRQSLLLSATMPSDIARLAESLLHKPERIEISPKVITVDRIEQRMYFRDAGDKLALLGAILEDQSLYRVIVFTRTKHRANRVADYLNKGNVPTEAIHGNKSQGARQRALASFRKGDTRVLVATDIAARGIDIDDVTHVINYELPNEAESYVHRIGRTARAGAEGIALSFCSPDERPYLRDIERLIKQTITDVDERPHMAHIPKKPPAPKRQGQNRSKAVGKGTGSRARRRPEGQPKGKGPWVKGANHVDRSDLSKSDSAGSANNDNRKSGKANSKPGQNRTAAQGQKQGQKQGQYKPGKPGGYKGKRNGPKAA